MLLPATQTARDRRGIPTPFDFIVEAEPHMDTHGNRVPTEPCVQILSRKKVRHIPANTQKLFHKCTLWSKPSQVVFLKCVYSSNATSADYLASRAKAHLFNQFLT